MTTTKCFPDVSNRNYWSFSVYTNQNSFQIAGKRWSGVFKVDSNANKLEKRTICHYIVVRCVLRSCAFYKIKSKIHIIRFSSESHYEYGTRIYWVYLYTAFVPHLLLRLLLFSISMSDCNPLRRILCRLFLKTFSLHNA